MKNDPQYLKDFVKQHPENKMGWYLLGRQYEEQGNKGKALQCYKKAGEIFEAYEEKELPRSPGDAPDELLVKMQADPIRAKSRSVGRMARLALIGLLLIAGTAFAPGTPDQDTAKQSEVVKAETAADANAVAQRDERQVFYAKGIENPEGLKQALSDMIFPRESPVRYAVLAQASSSKDGLWTFWPIPPRILLSQTWSDQGSAATVLYQDATSCRCQPSADGKASVVVKAWKVEREQLAVLRSAAVHYLQDKGKLPSSADALAGDYPNNRLPGLSPEMKLAWPGIIQDLQGGNGPGSGPSPQNGGTEKNPGTAGAGNSSGSGGVAAGSASPNPTLSTNPLSSTLEIIIDKSVHRLALVSGTTILRSYPVGLGGDKTPEGVFDIREKVRNPNGRSDGPFGSRGMALSDSLYAIHGTDAPWTVGKDESHGCIRMLKDDIEELYDMTPLGTKVTVTTGTLPSDILREKTRFRLPRQGIESNPGKIYRWLD
ncbi:L,D-transpeptidase [Gorillibacterium massiliense]|uniref:L,D-transpeptidase n=1 Tax=Gorillibacterium massiliense TaxID=1280390 RepID=UPI0004B2CA07|nr:L,D-transpeptidase [Gorillibacterium massiliense]